MKKLMWTDDGHFYIDGGSVTRDKFEKEKKRQQLQKQLNRIERKLNNLTKNRRKG